MLRGEEAYDRGADPEGEKVGSPPARGLVVVDARGAVPRHGEGRDEAGDGPGPGGEDLEDLGRVPHEALGSHAGRLLFISRPEEAR